MRHKLSFLLALLAFCQHCFAERQILDIQPENQNTIETCWLAVARMLFGYLQVQEYGETDCQVLRIYYGPQCNPCGRCIAPAGTMDRFENLLSTYPQKLHGASAAQIQFNSSQNALGWTQIVNQIRAQEPVVAGINPYTDGPSQIGPAHVALIVGFDDSTHTLIVNDPAPYHMVESFNPALPDPYLKAGATRLKAWRYEIRYDTFVNQFSWQYSVYDIVNPDHPYEPIPPSDPDTGQTLCPGITQLVEAAEIGFPNTHADESGKSSIQLSKDWNCNFNSSQPGWGANVACLPVTSKDSKDEKGDYQLLVGEIETCLKADNLEFTEKPDPNVDTDVFTVAGAKNAFVVPSFDTIMGVTLAITAMPTVNYQPPAPK